MEEIKTNPSTYEETLIRLVDEYQEMLVRLCFVCLQDTELARDATQETFLKAYRGLSSFHGGCSEKTWLSKIAINTCRSMKRTAWWRHIDRRVIPDDLPLAAEAACPEEEIDLMCAIMALPAKLKEVILLYYWQEMTVEEIAHALGLAHASVSGRLKRGREKLRDILEGRNLNG